MPRDLMLMLLYIGDLETTSLEEVRIIVVTGEDPDTINDKHISFTVTGTIIGSTANTITVQTDDGAIDTFVQKTRRISLQAAWNTATVCVLPSIHPNQNLLIFIQQGTGCVIVTVHLFSATRFAMQEI